MVSKPVVGLIVAGVKQKEAEEPEKTGNSSELVAAEALGKAVKAGDSAAIASAFRSLMRCCGDSTETEEAEEPSED